MGMSPDFGDLLKVSVPLACSLLTNPRPLLRAQWKWTWALSVFGYLKILQQYQQMYRSSPVEKKMIGLMRINVPQRTICLFLKPRALKKPKNQKTPRRA